MAIDRILKVVSTARFSLTQVTEGSGTHSVTLLKVPVQDSTCTKVRGTYSYERVVEKHKHLSV